MLNPNFNVLRDLHDWANDLLQLPATQNLLVQQRHAKCADKMAEESLRILDICGTTRDVLFLAKDHLQDLQSAFRRRSVEPGLENKIHASYFSRKKMKKEMFKCLKALKQMKSNCIPSPVSDAHDDNKFLVVVNLIQQVQVTTISILESVLSFMSMTRTNPKGNSNRKSFISKIMLVKRVATAPEWNVMGGVEILDRALAALHDNNFNLCEKTPVIAMQTATKQLETLKNAIEDLEIELDYIFRRLIQTRVSLLNILNS